MNHSDHAEVLLEYDVCLAEIPADQLHSDEARDYVTYYCGLECYQVMLENAALNTKPA